MEITVDRVNLRAEPQARYSVNISDKKNPKTPQFNNEEIL